MNSIGTLLFTKRKGQLVGTDDQGNQYYIESKPVAGRKARRWVIFSGGKVEASRVPPEWHAWLHYTVDQPLDRKAVASEKPFLKDHLANLTGSVSTYLPAGHDQRGGQRQRASGDYEAWQP